MWSRGNSTFTGSVKMVMMFAPCGVRGRPHYLLYLYLNFGLNLIHFIFDAMKVNGVCSMWRQGLPAPIRYCYCCESGWYWGDTWTDSNKSGADVMDRP